MADLLPEEINKQQKLFLFPKPDLIPISYGQEFGNSTIKR